MGATDQMIARYVAEIEERQQFVDGIFTAADGKDLTDDQLALVTDTRKRMEEVNGKIEPLIEMRRISGDSSARVKQIAEYMSNTPRASTEVEYRTAGAYILDYWRAGLGVEDARDRINTFDRAAAHQTTGDNPGLLPQQMIAPVISFIDESRPLVSALGPRNLPSGAWSRPKISQHVNVAPQVGEKTELVSRKMIIGMVPVTATTYGGYVNVSRQNVDWSQPQIMDLVINDLAAVYAQETEKALCVAVDAATTAGGSFTNASDIAGAIWAAVGTTYATMKGAGRTIIAVSPYMLGILGPLFAPINPVDSQSPGFSAGAFGPGTVGSVGGIPVVMSPGFDAGTAIVLNTAAVEVYEDRIGSLQVVEPSVLGVQVAYAGYFADLIIEPAGIVELTHTP